jgi:hypothetical protein
MPTWNINISNYNLKYNLKYISLINKMKYIFTLLSLLFSQVLSFNVIKPKLCLNCKHFITDNDNGKFGKCSLFIQKENIDSYMLVNGISENKNIEYYYCATARTTEDMCGKEGKMHKRKYIKKVVSLP